MKVVCAWCERDGHVVLLREVVARGAQNDMVSHGICDKHVLAVMAEASEPKDGPSVTARASVVHRSAS